MATITEDYVSFEVANLLKEKGFDEPCLQMWECGPDKKYLFRLQSSCYQNITEEDSCLAPTHQMAMAWLREKGVQMSIDTIISSSDGDVYFNIDTYSEGSGWDNPVNFYDSYEEAIEDAIKYSLKNLI